MKIDNSLRIYNKTVQKINNHDKQHLNKKWMCRRESRIFHIGENEYLMNSKTHKKKKERSVQSFP